MKMLSLGSNRSISASKYLFLLTVGVYDTSVYAENLICFFFEFLVFQAKALCNL